MTVETKATDTDKPKVVRITVPATDEVTMDFLEAQGPRGVTTAVRLLIHSFVAEHGNVDVLSAVSGSLVGTRPVTPAVPQDQDAEQASSAETSTETQTETSVGTSAGTSVGVSDTTAGSDAEVAVRPERDPAVMADDTPDGEVVSQDTGTAPGTVTGTETGTAAGTDTGVPDGGSPVSDMEDLFRQAGKK